VKEDAEIVGENSPFSLCIVLRQLQAASRGIRWLKLRSHGFLSAVVPSVGGLRCCQSPPIVFDGSVVHVRYQSIYDVYMGIGEV